MKHSQMSRSTYIFSFLEQHLPAADDSDTNEPASDIWFYGILTIVAIIILIAKVF